MATPIFKKKINIPFAQNGDMQEIPLRGDDETLGQDVGYPVVYEKPPVEGGQLIKRAQFNAIHNMEQSAIKELQETLEGGHFTVDEALALAETLPIAKGGTGATTVEQARINLGIGETDLSNYYNKQQTDNLLANRALTNHTHSQYALTSHSHGWNDISGKPTVMPQPSQTGKYPETFAGTVPYPFAHNGALGDIYNYFGGYADVANWNRSAFTDSTQRNQLPSGGSWLVFLVYGMNTGTMRAYNTRLVILPGYTNMQKYGSNIYFQNVNSIDKTLMAMPGELDHWYAIKIA